MLIYLKKLLFSTNLYLLLFLIWIIKQIYYSFETLSIYKNLSTFLIIFFSFIFILIFLAVFSLINKKKFLQYFSIVFFSLFFTNLFFDLFEDNIKKKNNETFYKDLLKDKNIYNKFDFRTQKQVVDDLKKIKPNVYPVIHPKHNVTKNSKLTSNLFPLSGISKSTIVFCNESGKYSIYKSDRYGFNNPDINYDNFTKKKVMLIGDSFVHGACVDEENTLSSQLNKINIPSFSISYGGNGPLLELATLIEYVIVVKPKIILWFYSENDLFDLNDEKKSEILMKYLNDYDFNQKLTKRQNEIDNFWKELLLRDFNIEDYVYYTKKKNFFQKFLRKVERAFLLKPSRDILKNYYKEKFKNFYLARDKSNLELFKRIIFKAKQISNMHNASFYFVYLPFLKSVQDKPLDSKNDIIKIVEELDIEIIDFYNYLTKEVNKPESFFPLGRHGHYNEEGYKILSDLISKSLNTF